MQLHVQLNSISENLYNKTWDNCNSEEKIEVMKEYDELNNR